MKPKQLEYLYSVDNYDPQDLSYICPRRHFKDLTDLIPLVIPWVSVITKRLRMAENEVIFSQVAPKH